MNPAPDNSVPATLFLTVSDRFFFPGTLATVNSVRRFHPSASIAVINNNVDKPGLSSVQIACLARNDVHVYDAELFGSGRRKLGAWELKAYAAASLAGGYELLVGIDSDCVLCGSIGDVLDSALKSGKFHGGSDGAVTYDDSYGVYGIEPGAANPKYMSTALYVCRVSEQNHQILQRWAECCDQAIFGGGGVFPGHGDQGVLNAVIYQTFGSDGVEILPNGLWSQHWCYWQQTLELKDGRLANKSLGQSQRAIHCGGSEKFWTRGHVELLSKYPDHEINYVWFHSFLWASYETVPAHDRKHLFSSESEHLLDDRTRLKDRIKEVSDALGLPGPNRAGQSPPRKILLRNSLSPGDIITLTAAVRDLHLTHPGRFITDVRTSCADLWENNPFVTRLEEEDPEVEQIQCEYPLIHKSNHAPYHMIHGFRLFLENKLGVRIEAHAFRGDIHLSPLEKSWMSQVEEIEGLGARFWIIVSGGKRDYTAKWWDPDRTQEVVDHFRGRIRFIQCGEGGHHHPRLNGVIDLVGKTNLRQIVRLMWHADGVICPVTMFMHLAAAVETRPSRPRNRPCVVIAGGREPAQWEAYPHHQFLHTNGALPCCDNGGCWKSRVEALGDGDAKDGSLCLRPVLLDNGRKLPECLAMITSQDVIRAVEQYLRFNDPPATNIQRTTAGPSSNGHTMTGRNGYMKKPVSKEQMESFARALQAAKNANRYSPEAFNALHAQFRAEDAKQIAWTVGIQSAQWHCLLPGGWVSGDPPKELALEEAVLATLETLKQSFVPKPVDSDVQKCSKCGTEITSPKKFCPHCGTSVVPRPDPPPVQRLCPKCHAPVPTDDKFCGSCGASTSEPAPPPPPPRSDRLCSKCGRIVAEQRKFCTACGTPVS